MRRMRLSLIALALVLFGLAASTSSLQSQEIVNLTNQVWRYDQSGVDPGAFWDIGYDDSLWPEGRGIFAFENSANAQLSANVYPFTNTQLTVGQTVPYYFRTHFDFSLGDPANYVLSARTLIDDGYIIYINGQEVNRYNMNAGSTAAQAANPAGEGVPIVRELAIPPGALVVGDNVLAVAAYQNNITSSDIVFGTAITASLGYRPRILSPTAPSSVTVEQGRNHTLSVTVDAAPAATIQWVKDDVDISGATGASYTITDMDSTKTGVYYARASNSLGSSNSPTVTVAYDPDDTAPVLLAATADLSDLTRINLFFSENITGQPGTDPLDPIYYIVEDNNGFGHGAAIVTYGSSSNIVVLFISPPRDPALTYRATISLHTIVDLFGNPLADPSTAPVSLPVVVQEGLNGYTGTQDTEVRANLPDSAAGGAQATVNVDTADPNAVHALLKFDNLIGGQIPFGAVILSAQLRIWTDNQTAAGTPPRLVRMMAPWSEASTWNSLVNGVDTEAGVTDATIDGAQDDSFDTLNVTAAVQSWADGAVNNGWAFLPAGDDGWRWGTSEFATADSRPMLSVDFYVVPNPCSISDQPDPVTVNEKSPFTLSVGSSGSGLTFQWYRNDVAIPGATASSYTVARAVPADSGTYHVVIQGDTGDPCVSADALVTVTPDNQRPVLTSSLGNFNQTTITLTFDDTMDPASAGNAANYTLNNGVTVSGATVAGNTVTLTTTTPRVVGTDYTLTITGVRDDAVALNLINPNPTVTNLAQQVKLLPFGSSWKFETNGTDQGTAWRDVGFDDSAWPADVALLGNENTAATATALAAQGLNTNNMMLWPLVAGGPGQIITYYLRGSVNIPYDLANATVTLRFVIDDGALYYFNGEERFRFDMPAGDINYLTEAGSATGEGIIRTQNLTNIACGDNLIAVEVHNDTPTSTDILFDAELLATFTTFQTCASGGPELSIVNNGDGTVTLSWAPPGGNLEESDDLTNWVPSARTNGGTFTPTGFKFYRVAP